MVLSIFVDHVLQNANPDMASSDGLTPLHLAAARGFGEMVSMLVHHGASVTIKVLQVFHQAYCSAFILYHAGSQPKYPVNYIRREKYIHVYMYAVYHCMMIYKYVLCVVCFMLCVVCVVCCGTTFTLWYM